MNFKLIQTPVKCLLNIMGRTVTVTLPYVLPSHSTLVDYKKSVTSCLYFQLLQPGESEMCVKCFKTLEKLGARSPYHCGQHKLPMDPLCLVPS
jgi:hypothetical protein